MLHPLGQGLSSFLHTLPCVTSPPGGILIPAPALQVAKTSQAPPPLLPAPDLSASTAHQGPGSGSASPGLRVLTSAGAEARRGAQEPWVTLTAEGLRVLPGQLPFQRPAGEGKAYRLNLPSRQAGPGARQEPLLPAPSGWGMGTPRTHTPLVTLCSWAGGRPMCSAQQTSHP